jgi:hypothetical protein
LRTGKIRTPLSYPKLFLARVIVRDREVEFGYKGLLADVYARDFRVADSVALLK